MQPYARQSLGGWRNEACLIPITVPGLDLTGVSIRAQVRPSSDNPVLTLDLEPTADPNATGIRLVNVTREANGVPTSNLMWQVAQVAMQGLPYAGELGDPWIGTYALQIAGITRMTGAFAALASPIDSNAAPANRVPGFGGFGDGAIVSGVVLTIVQGGVTVSIAAVDVIAPLVIQAQASANSAAASLLTAQQQATLATIKAQIAQQSANDSGNYLAAIRAVVGGAPVTATLPLEATSRAIMAGFTGMVAGKQALLSEYPRAGLFTWSTLNLSAKVAADPLQGIYVPPTYDMTGASGAWVRLDIARPCPEWWGGGAGGDDSDAFAALGDFVTSLGGGSCELAGSYTVGRQTLLNDGTYSYRPARLLEIVGCVRPVVIRAKGAKIRFANGLHFGTFGANGQATNHAMPYTSPGEIATPCPQGILAVQNNVSVVFEGACEIDGNVKNMVIGGQWGDTGWQLGGDGLFVMDNAKVQFSGTWEVHHCPRDGMQMRTPSVPGVTPKSGSVHAGLWLHNNVRNNLSIGSGVGHTFIGCRFTSASKDTPIASAPSACVDLEAEVGPIRFFTFEDCEFSDGGAHGLVADSGDTADVVFRSCRFIGTTGYACWPRKPRMRFFDCVFVGSIPVLYSDGVDPRNSTQFRRCYFTDDTTLSPTGQVSGPYLIDGGGGNYGVLIEQCKLNALNRAAVYFDGGNGLGAFWRDSQIKQAAGTPQSIFSVNLQGVYNSYDGPALSAPGLSYAGGRLSINGADPCLYTASCDPAPIPVGGEVTVAISALGRPLDYGWKVDATFDKNLAGATMTTYVAAPDTIIVTFANNTAAPIDLPAGNLVVRARPMT